MANERDEKLDNPLVVHKESDASYQAPEDTSATENISIDDEEFTFERHRFRKEKKKRHPVIYIIIAVVVVVAIIVGLYYGGAFSGDKEESVETTTKESETTTEGNKFEGIITVKDTYIFFEGEEVDGINGLEKCIKYMDKGTHFIVQDESADPDFLNGEVVDLLQSYDIDYEITYIVSSGLVSQYE